MHDNECTEVGDIVIAQLYIVIRSRCLHWPFYLQLVHFEPRKWAEGAIIHILQVRLNTIGKDAVLVKIINSYPIVLDTCLSRRILNWSPKGDESN